MSLQTAAASKPPLGSVETAAPGRVRLSPAVGASLIWLAAAILWLYRPALGWWWSHWFRAGTENYYGHGPFIPLFIGVVLWARRDAWSKLKRRPRAAGLAVILVALGMALLGRRVGSNWVLSLSLPLLVVGGLAFTLGWRSLRLAGWPLLLGMFAIPLPMWLLSRVTVPPQMLSADLSATAFRTLGMGVEQLGSTLYLSRYALDVATACSGFRLLITLMAFATFLVALTRAPAWRRALLWVLAPAAALFANVVRIVAIGLAGEFGSERLAEMMHHAGAQGLVILAIVLYVLLAKALKCPLSLDG